MPDKKTCFIIMPLTTPDEFADHFKGDKDHFLHVLEHLFIPAIEKAGFKPLKPIAKGSDLIQAEIIKNLNEANLVLCDMSILNPNVFFEYGIRTALNKPVCVVKDHSTDKVPFDTTIINYHNYSQGLNAWEITNEIEKLSKHIVESYDRNPTDNNLWKYFGLTTKVQLDVSQGNEQDKLDLILIEMNSLKESFSILSKQDIKEKIVNTFFKSKTLRSESISNRIKDELKNLGAKYQWFSVNGESGEVDMILDTMNSSILQGLNSIALKHEIRIQVKARGYDTVILPEKEEILANYKSEK